MDLSMTRRLVQEARRQVGAQAHGGRSEHGRTAAQVHKQSFRSSHGQLPAAIPLSGMRQDSSAQRGPVFGLPCVQLHRGHNKVDYGCFTSNNEAHLLCYLEIKRCVFTSPAMSSTGASTVQADQ